MSLRSNIHISVNIVELLGHRSREYSFHVSGGLLVIVDLQTWKTDPDTAETVISVHSGQHSVTSVNTVTYPPVATFSLNPLPPQSVTPSAAEMISMEMPPMGHIGQPHPGAGHHQPQMSPGYESNSDKKKRECMLFLS